jgi:hypothetical protein
MNNARITSLYHIGGQQHCAATIFVRTVVRVPARRSDAIVSQIVVSAASWPKTSFSMARRSFREKEVIPHRGGQIAVDSAALSFRRCDIGVKSPACWMNDLTYSSHQSG